EDSCDASNRVLRGGSWNNNNNNARAAYRNNNNNNPNNRNNNIGFRVLRPTCVSLFKGYLVIVGRIASRPLLSRQGDFQKYDATTVSSSRRRDREGAGNSRPHREQAALSGIYKTHDGHFCPFVA
ncbi:MAG: SUMF1/EgtB/PvdO family nonheme iron enzyme, partial [Phototrophicaceae bacterium]